MLHSDAGSKARSAMSTMWLLASGLLLATSLQTNLYAQVSVSAPAQRVVLRGSVYDSLLMKPVANATVWIPGTSQTTQADDNGRFELDDVATGLQFIAFSSPGLDSLGLGTLGFRVEVARSNARVELFTPSFRSVWRALCSQAVSATRDSGIVWGTVRDAGTDGRLNGAAAAFSWYDMNINAQNRFDFREMKHDVRTDSTGTYYACGLPVDIKLSSEATGTRSASGAIEYVIGDRRVIRVDMLVSTDMVLQKGINEATVVDMTARGTARLRGRVVDAKGKDVVGATVTLASLDTTVRTNAAGEFTMLNLPAGSHGIQARQLGFSPATMQVELRPGQLTQITLTMADARQLATVNVRAERVAGTDQQDFLLRSKSGLGYTLKDRDMRTATDIAGILQGMPAVQISRNRGAMQVAMSNRKGGTCTPMLYLDRFRTSGEELSVFKPEDFAAVEVYNSQFTVPTGFQSADCGAILFWTKRNPRW